MLLKSQAKLTEGVGESFLLAAYFGALDRLFIEKGQPALVEVTTSMRQYKTHKRYNL